MQGNFYKVLSADFFFYFFKVSFYRGEGEDLPEVCSFIWGPGNEGTKLEDAVPYSPSSIVPKNKGTMPFPYTYT